MTPEDLDDLQLKVMSGDIKPEEIPILQLEVLTEIAVQLYRIAESEEGRE